jgi:hypothetical protein
VERARPLRRTGEDPVLRLPGQVPTDGLQHLPALPGLPRRNPRPRARPAAPSAPQTSGCLAWWGGGADERALAPPLVIRATLARGGNTEAERRTRGAPGGGCLAEAARRTCMSEADVLDLALARSAWKSMVSVHLGAGNAHLRWSKTPLPALENLGELGHVDAFGAANRDHIFLNDTALERADGYWGPAVRRLVGHHASAHATVATLAAAFNEHFALACLQPRSTLSEYWRALRLVVTWAVARRAVLDNVDILPMLLDTLKALTWDLVCFAFPSSQIKLVWKSVQARHLHFQLRQPLCKANQYASWVKMLGSVNGRPLALNLPVQKVTERWLLAWRPTSLAAHRERLLTVVTVVATLACMRVNKVARLQVCNLWFDYLASYGVLCFEGTCLVHIDRRKNDTVHKGHNPALGRSKDPELDIVP